MIFAKNLYMGHHAAEHHERIMTGLKERTLQLGCYLITPAKDEKNLFEIYPASMLYLSGMDSENFFVLGIGFGEKDAWECVRIIVEDMLKAQTFDVREFLRKREEIQ